MKTLKTKIVAAFLCTSSFAFAQGIYVEVNGGYGLPFNTDKDIIGESTYMVDYTTPQTMRTGSYKNIGLSLGKGVNFGATLGYMFNKHIGVELQYSYLLGAKTEGINESTYKDDFGGQISIETDIYEDTYASRFSRVIPAIVLQTGFEKVNPYAKIGVVLGFGAVELESTYTENDNGVVTTEHRITEYNGSVAIGLNTRFGVLIKGSGKLSYFAEINFVGMNYSPSKGKVTTYEVDGINMLSTLTVSESQAEFSDEVTYSDDSDDDKPSQEIKVSLPFGSFGLNVGLRITL